MRIVCKKVYFSQIDSQKTKVMENSIIFSLETVLNADCYRSNTYFD